MPKGSGVLESIQHMPNNWYCFSQAVVLIQATGLRHHEERRCLMSADAGGGNVLNVLN